MENYWWSLQTPRGLFTWWLIRSSVSNHLQFPPLETQENYNINLDSSNRSLKSIPANLVDQVWTERPPIPPDHLTRLPDRVIREFHSMCLCCRHVAVCSSTFVMPFMYALINTCKQAAISGSTNTAINSLFMFFMAGWRIKLWEWKSLQKRKSSRCPEASLVFMVGEQTNGTNGEHHNPNGLCA